MQLEHLQYVLGGLGLVLVALVLFALRSRIRLPKVSVPMPAMPRVPLGRAKDVPAAEPVSELSPQRLARLKSGGRAERAGEAAHAAGLRAEPGLSAVIEGRLEEAFSLYEQGAIDLDAYRLKVDDLSTGLGEIEDLHRAGLNPQMGGEIADARKAVDWCLDWAGTLAEAAPAA